MNTYIPKKPVGSSAFWMFMRAVWDFLWGGKFPFIDTDSVRWTRRPGVGYAAQVVNAAKSSGAADRMFPFRLYRSPLPIEPTSTQLANAWRTVRVRAGDIVGDRPQPVVPSGTDGAARPDSEVVPAFSTDIEIVLPLPESPETELRSWFWLAINEAAGTASIQNSVTPPAVWTLRIIPIGHVTVSTEELRQAVVRQWERTDVFIPCLFFPEVE